MATATTTARNSVSAILSRAFTRTDGEWPPEVARGMLALAFPSAHLDRADQLAAKAREGTLNPNEEIEIENYRQAGRLLELMKAKALASPARQGVTP